MSVDGDREHNHVFLDKEDPAVFRALNAVALKAREAAIGAGITSELIELINLRVSQLNGCAFCLRRHTILAVELGVDPDRLSVLAAWQDTDLFTPKERAALLVAETVADLPPAGARDHNLETARQELTEGEFSAIAWIAITIGAFNRVSIISRHPVLKDQHDGGARLAAERVS
ncbi:carboxymuconolactone decarboxylase family protein [Arthrobacter sp. B1805]|uniref:carboxymuconolactone decarboxylase family protein n=1 Tax=Arthrobacter sp. B1805 TaxID=2058892 RepID=UPI000CE3CE8C|nr:carboxymuconolactone decarboxylase family protein [Arthrobacter sp. B1805]